MEHVIFDGVDLSDNLITLVKENPMPAVESRHQHVNGSDGYVQMGADYLPEPVTVRLVMPDVGMRERRRLVRWLAGILYTREPKPLAISSDNGLWRMATLSERPDVKELVRSGAVDVRFQPEHAAYYGESHKVTVPSGGSAAFYVEGTYPASVRVTATAARPNGSSGVWGIRADEGDFLHIPLTAQSSIEADCEARTCVVNGSVKLPTLDSDWLSLEGGSHTVRNDQGSGECVLTWTERYL